MKLERLLSITVTLLNRNSVQAKELSEKFNVSIRTIYRDIEAINAAGIPIVSLQGKNGGFTILDTFKIDKHTFTNDDIRNTIGALKSVSNALGDPKLDVALEKLINIGISKNKNILDVSDDKIIIDFAPEGFSNKQKNKLKQVYYALENCLPLEFDYSNSRGENTRRVCEPITLTFQGFSWYLLAYCRLKSDFRLFKISRMDNLQTHVKKFERQKFSFADFKSNVQKINYNKVDFIFKISPKAKYKIEDYFDKDKIETLSDGSLIINQTWHLDDWIYSFLLSFGEELEIISPEYVKVELCRKAKNILNIYNNLT
jgi:predicted DNA-binding transcriptional regulator YafY